ncbi:hypothetical protein [Teredinibacter sp. KSP-S5-2]|uniref:hypothetical protein n=1 Tax=Teredinibacter sp. KSP-S5-2 TaxID=3034506 RepID=UPI0029349DB3|nr:hypothetical protein [Teredinibacter sp. KSP-S5-2]WNO11272.1 hypothetical protein P5V12_08820 [Teredinibacter sp. KSP-S5-2]
MENGREPNAGVSLVGYIVFPVFFLGLAYVGNLIFNDLGWYIVFGLFSVIFLHAVFTIPKAIKKHNELLKNRESS